MANAERSLAGKLKKVRVGTLLQVVIGVLFTLGSLALILLVHRQMQQQALAEARSKARILLDRNLATHAYFTHQLKPALFEWSEPLRDEETFDPVWMSSTYAVREIDTYFQTLSPAEYYYKESAINARTPENEADAYEGAFIEELNQDPDLQERSLVRTLDGQPTFVTLRRGEAMEESCLRCHSTPDAAPRGLVDVYGPERSFDREEGEVVSAVSIRVPLAEAYGDADRFAGSLSLMVVAILVALFLVQSWLNQTWLFGPLDMLRGEALQIASSSGHLGEQIPLPAGQELRGLALAFNEMSANLRRSYDHLEDRVANRTVDLGDANRRLAQEIAERKRADEMLRGVIEASPLPVFVIDADGLVETWNKAAERVFGWREEEVVGRPLPIVPTSDQEEFGELRRRVLTGESLHDVEIRRRRKDGEMRDVVLSAAAIHDASGRRVGIMAVMDDVTEQRRMERALKEYSEQLEDMVAERTRALRKAQEQLLRREKLALLGQLAGSVNHELRDPLGTISAGVDLLEMALEDPEKDVTETLDIMDRSVDHAVSIVDSLLNFARTETSMREEVRLDELIAEVLLNSDVPAGIEIVRQDYEPPSTILADPEHLRQVLRNLVSNAVEAMPEGGRITVDTATVSTEPETDDEVIISVSDTGEGMSEETQERLFEPLYTTKAHGIGLGLALANLLVEAHGGTIEVESEVGVGSTFAVRLPLDSGGLKPEAGHR